MQTMISTVDVVLSGDFHNSYGYVTIDGTKYKSAQTITVAKGTSVTVLCSASSSTGKKKCKITLNGTTVAQGGKSSAAEYTFAVTSNCSIAISKELFDEEIIYRTAAITMPS